MKLHAVTALLKSQRQQLSGDTDRQSRGKNMLSISPHKIDMSNLMKESHINNLCYKWTKILINLLIKKKKKKVKFLADLCTFTPFVLASWLTPDTHAGMGTEHSTTCSIAALHNAPNNHANIEDEMHCQTLTLRKYKNNVWNQVYLLKYYTDIKDRLLPTQWLLHNSRLLLSPCWKLAASSP